MAQNFEAMEKEARKLKEALDLLKIDTWDDTHLRLHFGFLTVNYGQNCGYGLRRVSLSARSPFSAFLGAIDLAYSYREKWSGRTRESTITLNPIGEASLPRRSDFRIVLNPVRFEQAITELKARCEAPA